MSIERTMERHAFASLRIIAPEPSTGNSWEFEPLNLLASIDRQLLRSSAMDRQEETIAPERGSRRARIS